MVKNFVVRNIFISIKTTIKAGSLIELLIFMIIIAILITSFWSYNHFDKKTNDQNLLRLKKLQHALYLARSEAIALQTKVYVCPTHNRAVCSYNWTSEIMIFVIDQEKKQPSIKILSCFKSMFRDPMLRFQFFGNQQEQKIIFLPNGLTINNGHFCTDNGAHCLYINQAGRVYIKTKAY